MGGRENFTLSDDDEEVTLTVELDLDERHESMFDLMWPKALAKLKELTERKPSRLPHREYEENL